MASSVAARMPSDEWRHHHSSRLHVHTHKSLPKVLTRISTSIDQSAATSAVSGGSEPCSPATAAKRRQSQIVSRWAARQARDVITTIERQAHEEELSVLSTMTQPVSARAASLLRETSPEIFAAPASREGSDSEIAPTVRASSLIQMWREMEAEAGTSNTSQAMAIPPPAKETAENFPDSDACDEGDVIYEWENADSSSSSSAESEKTDRKKVGDIVRMLSLRITSSTTSSGDESELSVKDAPGNAPAAALLPLSSPLRGISKGERRFRVRGRRGMEDLVLKQQEERRREVAALAERRPVSLFPFRGRIQSLIRLKSLRREVASIKHQQQYRESEAEICETGSDSKFLRKGSEGSRHHDINEISEEESMKDMEVLPSNSRVSGIAIPVKHSDAGSNHFLELVSTRGRGSSPQSFFSPAQVFFTPLSRQEDLQQSLSSDASWDEKSLWGSNLFWQRPSDSNMSQTWQGDAASEGTEASTQDQQPSSAEFNWLLEPSNSWRGSGVIRRTFYNDLMNSNSNNPEIRELLEMKTVTSSLASEFSAKMNQILGSILRRKEQRYADENGENECEEQSLWHQHYEQADQETAAISLARLPSELLRHSQENWKNALLSSQMLHNQESWKSISLQLPSQMMQLQNSGQSSPFTQSSSSSMQEGENVQELKNCVAQMHQEIFELRKLVESCLDWQKNLEHSIKQDVFSAVNQLAVKGNLLHKSKYMQGRKDTCCICCEAQVESLLYRCGHMCACYKCAQELQWNSGRCPICQSHIADVIRTYPNF